MATMPPRLPPPPQMEPIEDIENRNGEYFYSKPPQMPLSPQAGAMDNMASLMPPPTSGGSGGLTPPPLSISDPEQKKSFLQKILPYLPLAAGTAIGGIGALSGNTGLLAFGSGGAGASSDVLMAAAKRKQDEEAERNKNRMQNVGARIDKMRRLAGTDPRFQRIVTAYDEALQDGVFSAKEALKLQQEMDGLPDVEGLIQEAEMGREADKHKRFAEIDERLRRARDVQVTPEGAPGPLSVSPEAAVGYYGARERQLNKPPVMRTIAGPDGRPMVGVWDPNTNSFVPSAPMPERGQWMIRTDPVSGEQTAVPMPAVYGHGGGGGGGPAPTPADGSPSPISGKSGGVSLGVKPIGVPDVTQQKLSGLSYAYSQLQNVQPLLAQVVGPGAGQVLIADVERLGGLGASKAQIEAAVRLRELVASKAFENGGKQLTETEKMEFKFQVPSMSDTLEQAAIKADLGLKAMRNAYAARVATMPQRQRVQVPSSIEDAIRGMREHGGQIGDQSGAQQKYRVGQTATDPKTGKKVRFDGAQWLPIQ